VTMEIFIEPSPANPQPDGRRNSVAKLWSSAHLQSVDHLGFTVLPLLTRVRKKARRRRAEQRT
jgi:hypothetical protein